MTFSEFEGPPRQSTAPIAWWRRVFAAGWELATSGLGRLQRNASDANARDSHRLEPAFVDGIAPHLSHGTSRPPLAKPVECPDFTDDKRARRDTPPTETIRLDAHAEALPASAASMEVVEAYVDIVRRAKGKLTLSEIELDLPDFELHLEDFVRDVFQTMVVDDPRYRP